MGKEVKQETKADFVIEINGISAQFKKPDFKVWKFAAAAMEKSGSLAFKIAMVKNCCLDAKSELLSDAYIQDTIRLVSDLIDYEKAIIEKDGNAWKVFVGDKSCRLKPISVEAQMISERENAKSEPFRTKQNLLNLLWINGDEEIRSEKNPELLIPILGILDELRDKHIATIKKL